MTRSEIIARLIDNFPYLYIKDAEKIVDTVFSEISEALASGDRVEIRGFGAFSVKHRNSRMGRNPRTGENVAVNDRFVPSFKVGKELRDKLNSSES